MKKHLSQMTKEEVVALQRIINSTKSWGVARHCYKRLKERGVSKAMTLDAIKHGTIIEFSQKGNCYGVLIRSTKVVLGKYVVCALVSLDSKRIITVYVNLAHDSHRTLDWSAYNENLDILNVIKKEQVHEKTR